MESYESLLNALTQLLQMESSEELQKIKQTILTRIANETEVKPSRIPSPLNITEVGGYFNLIEQTEVSSPELKDKKAKMQLELIAAALGLPT